MLIVEPSRLIVLSPRSPSNALQHCTNLALQQSIIPALRSPQLYSKSRIRTKHGHGYWMMVERKRFRELQQFKCSLHSRYTPNISERCGENAELEGTECVYAVLRGSFLSIDRLCWLSKFPLPWSSGDAPRSHPTFKIPLISVSLWRSSVHNSPRCFINKLPV